VVSQQALLIYKCELIGAQYWLASDMTLECYTSDWTYYALLSLISICVFAVGVPVASFYLLYLNSGVLTGDIYPG
jgi:hypothetical protein